MSAPSSSTFADLLRYYRMSAGLTQEELAAKAHLSVDAISTLERGARKNPRRDTVALLADALALSPEDRTSFQAAARRTDQNEGARNSLHAQPEPEQQPEDTQAPVSSLAPANDAVGQETPAPADSARQEAIKEGMKRLSSVLDARNLKSRQSIRLLYRVLPLMLVVAVLVGGPWRDNLPGVLNGGAHDHSSPPPAAPETEQVLQIAVSSLSTLDPQLVSVVDDYETTQLIFPGLVQLDEHLRVENWAASHIAISPDGRTYTFTIRSGLTWSNGIPITADDFAFAINRALNPCTQASAPSYLFPIADAAAFNHEPCANGVATGALETLIGRSLQVIDRRTLVLHLHNPAAYFLDALTYPNSWAVPRALISRYGAHWTDHLADAGGLGGDLFKVSDWQPGSRLVLQRNERFWSARAKLREIDVSVTADVKKMYAAYLAGKGDMSLVATEESTSAAQRSDFHEVPALQMLHLRLNWSKPPFNDERIRQAFALALNKVQLDRDSFADAVFPSNHLVPQGMPGYFAELTEPDSTQNLTGNLAKATALAQAYANDQCGGDLRKCPPVTLGILNLIPNATTFAEEARNMWLQAMPGYPISISVEKFPDLYAPQNVENLSLLTLFWAADYPDPQDWLSNLFLPESPFDFGHVSLPAASTLLRQADREQNLARRLSAYNQAEQLLVNEGASIPLFQMKVTFVARLYVINYQITALGLPSSNTWERVYIARH